MAPPPWSLLRLRLPGDEIQDVIFVYHGDAKGNISFTPSELPVALHLGRGFRSWRGDSGPQAEIQSTSILAARVRRSDHYDEFLRAPSLPTEILAAPSSRIRSSLHWRRFIVAILHFMTIISLLLPTIILAVLLVAQKAESVDISSFSQWLNSSGWLSAASPNPILIPRHPYTLLKTMATTQDLRDLISTHHQSLHDSWAILHEDFSPAIEDTVKELNLLTTPSSPLTPSHPDASDVLNLLVVVRKTFDKALEEQAYWNNEVLAKWTSLAAWWNWGEPNYSPWNHLPALIPANDTAYALDTFVSVVSRHNERVYRLVDEIVCSGYDGLLPWHGMQAHYAQARDALFDLHKDLRTLFIRLANRDRSDLIKTGQVDLVLGHLLTIVHRAHMAAKVGRDAAQLIGEEIGTICKTAMQITRSEWRITAQGNDSLSREYGSLYYNSTKPIEDIASPQPGRILAQLWDRIRGLGGGNKIAVTGDDNIEVTEMWLAWPPTVEAVNDLSTVARVVWESRYRNRK
ncbi:hypothetical protein F4677DRAFT_464160 [Hypoxylon crocopeplum]|nr:hypothetical protein F4677DRAFT_464160 [Hypoxylon crocopeplum]